MDPDKLDEFLEVLREYGVTRFACSDFSVSFGPAEVAEDDSDEVHTRTGELIKVRPGASTSAHGVYGHPSLWAGGAPLTFPKPGT